MTTKLKNIKINPEYKSLGYFDSQEDQIEHEAQMISYRVLSVIEEICEQRNLKKKDLAARIGSSRSYITQLFQGSKSVNTQVMAKFENALDITFEIKATLLGFSEKNLQQFLNPEVYIKNRNSNQMGRWYFCPDLPEKDDILNDLKTKNLDKQVA